MLKLRVGLGADAATVNINLFHIKYSIIRQKPSINYLYRWMRQSFLWGNEFRTLSPKVTLQKVFMAIIFHLG